MIRLGKDVESTAVQTDAWHHRADALTSIAAFVGISIALVGGEKWQSADAWAALFACAVIAANGYRLLFPALHEMLDTAERPIFGVFSGGCGRQNDDGRRGTDAHKDLAIDVRHRIGEFTAPNQADP